MHMSVPIEGTVEVVEKTEVSPLIDKCVIKVCYVGEQPNRNGTVLTKEVAYEMGRKILGSPIVFIMRVRKILRGIIETLRLEMENLRSLILLALMALSLQMVRFGFRSSQMTNRSKENIFVLMDIYGLRRMLKPRESWTKVTISLWN